MLANRTQRPTTGGLRNTSGPRPLVTRPAKLFANLFFLLQTRLFCLLQRI